MKHRSGFVNIIGNPNVGKSTLMNAMVGERLSIITSKSQTTRHRIMGIVNGEDYQIVYSDTPGILKPHYRLQESMMEFVQGALGDADIILYVTDTIEKSDKHSEYIEKLSRIDCPVLLVLNKIDISSQEEVAARVAFWKQALPKAEIFAISATEKFGLDGLFERILSLLPEAEPWYDKDMFTDRNLRFFASEIIREKILLQYSDEVPYCCEVVIEEFREGEERYHIRAVVNVMRDSQKGIIIGKGGSALKKLGTAARLDMEEFFQKKVFLEIFVRVDPSWRDDKRKLKAFGYV
ncbi:MAG: GTPase Era [Bacteroidales bacterium]|nr:GTPase Era [Bacteroidales bacterium]